MERAPGASGHGAAGALARLLDQAAQATGVPPHRVFTHNGGMTDQELAESVRQACIQAALDAYEDAGIAGLCAEGRWEAAISALQSLDLDALRRAQGSGTPAARG